MRVKRGGKKQLSIKVKLAAVLSVVAALILVAVLLYKPSTPNLPYDGPKEDITVGFIGEYATLILIADNQGYFENNGLNVTLKEYSSGPAALADLLAGKTDISAGSDFAGVSNSFHNPNIRILATLSESEAFLVVARKDKGVNAPSDLKHKRVGITRKTVGEFYIGQFLTFNNVVLSDVRIADMTQDLLINELRNGTIDAAVLFEPNAYRIKKELGDLANSWSVQNSQSIYTTLFGTERLTNERPEEIKRFMKALKRAEDFVKFHNSEAKNLVASRLKYDSEYIDYIWPKFRFDLALDQELLLNMNTEARWLIENKLTDASAVPNFLRMMNFDGMQAAKPEGITVIR